MLMIDQAHTPARKGRPFQSPPDFRGEADMTTRIFATIPAMA
jgi:hypothetical protein